MKTKLRAPPPPRQWSRGGPILGTPGGTYIGNTQPHDYGKNLPPPPLVIYSHGIAFL